MSRHTVPIVIAMLGVVGVTYGVATRTAPATPPTGSVREVTIVARHNQWRFDPEFIDAVQGERIVATVVNEDDFDHGFAIDMFGVYERIPARSTVKVAFTVTEAGDFPYYCSVSCGGGVVEGERRGHFDMYGKLHVRSTAPATR